MLSRAEIIENEVVVCNDACRTQHFVVPREVGIACERYVIAETRGTSASGVHTILGHGLTHPSGGFVEK